MSEPQSPGSCNTCNQGPYVVIAILSGLVIVLGIMLLNRPAAPPDSPTTTVPQKSDPDDFATSPLVEASPFEEFDPVAATKQALESAGLAEAEKQLEFALVGTEEQREWAKRVQEEIAQAKSPELAKEILGSMNDKQLRLLVALAKSPADAKKYLVSLPEDDDLRKSFASQPGEPEREPTFPGEEVFLFPATLARFQENLREQLAVIAKARQLDQPVETVPAESTIEAKPEIKVGEKLPPSQEPPAPEAEPQK